MVTKIATGKNIRGILNYNEHKVKEGTASLITAHGFGAPTETLSFHEKLTRFEKLIEKNQRAKTNALHFSLNFETSEKLHQDVLKEIARVYMEKIGFGHQPYLVYEHKDTAHPHIHILTTNIQSSGKRISVHNLEKNASEVARKEIEIEFNLIKAAGRGKTMSDIHLPVPIQTAVYGKTETKRAISNIVREVTRSYKYTSLAELNAVLSYYNILANNGKAGSRMNARRGLTYSIINEKGEKLGVPIKSSSIYGKPTLAFLDKQFAANALLRKQHRKNLMIKIDNALASPFNRSTKKFKYQLQKEGVDIIYRTNDSGKVYGITFVDHRNKTVFNGSDLGKKYSANHLTEILSGTKPGKSDEVKENLQLPLETLNKTPSPQSEPSIHTSTVPAISNDLDNTLKELLNAKEGHSDFVPSGFSRRKKKKRRNRSL